MLTCVYGSMCSGVYWGASPGFPAHHSYPAAAAGPAGRPGSQTVAVWRLNRHRGETQHHCGSGKYSSAQLFGIQLDII